MKPTPATLQPGRAQSRRPAGFTLVELMIVVAIVAILAALAYPAYTGHVLKARRAQAKADLVEYAQLAERWHTVNNTYQGFSLPVTQSPREPGATARYALALDNVTATTFTIVATAQGDQAEDRCGNLSINQAGVKTSSGPAPLADCW